MEDNTTLNFLNKYNEVILDNLTSILKQNLVFQTQINLLEDQVKDKEQLEKRLIEKESAVDLSSELAHLRNELKDKEDLLAISGNGSADAHRLQNALNTHMKDLADKKIQVTTLETEKKNSEKIITEQLTQIRKLENMLPKEEKVEVAETVVKKVVAKKVNKKEKIIVKEEKLDLVMKSEGNTSSGGTF